MKLLLKLIYLTACGIWAVAFVLYVKGEYYPTIIVIGFSMFLAAMFFFEKLLDDWKVIVKRGGDSDA